jgi:MFS transporter, FSR family, fosmidomycin resistance protein
MKQGALKTGTAQQARLTKARPWPILQTARPATNGVRHSCGGLLSSGRLSAMQTKKTTGKETPAAMEQTGAAPFQTGRVIGLSLCHFINDVYTSFLSPLLPLLIQKLSMSLAQAGFLSTVLQVPSLLNPYIGALADRVSVRYFIIAAPALTAIPMSLIGLAPTYAVLLILLFITGISVSIFHVPAPVMISRVSGNRVGRGMSLYMAGGEVARTLGPLAAIGAVSILGLEGFYPVMIFGLIASIWLFISFKDIPIDNPGKQRGGSIGKAWHEARSVLAPLIAILFARGFMHASMGAFLPTFIEEETGNLWLGGMALTIFQTAGVLGVLISGSLSDYFGRRRVLFFSLLAAPLGLLMFIWLEGWPRFAALLFTGLTLLSTTPVMLAMVQERAIKNPAAANGLFMMISFVARSAIVVLVGFVGDMMGLQTTYIISALLGFLGIPFIFMLPRR